MSAVRLRGASHLEADRELLKKLAPAHDLLKKAVFRRPEFAAQLLYALLDLTSEEDIRNHRREYLAAQSKDQLPVADPEPPKELTSEEIVALLADLGYLPLDTMIVLGEDAFRLTEGGFVAQEWREIESTAGETATGEPGKIEDSATDAEAGDVIFGTEEKADEVIANAEAEAEEILSDAEAEAEEIIEEAEQKAEEIIEEAETEKKSVSPKPAVKKPAAKKPAATGSSKKPSTPK